MASATTPFTGSCSALPASKTVSSAGNSISSSIDSNTNVSNIITSTTEHSQISDFSYCLSSELDINMVFKITSIEGYRPQIPLSKMLQDPYLRVGSTLDAAQETAPGSDIYISMQLFAENKPLLLPIRASFKYFKGNTTWNECIELPIKYCNLPATSQLSFTLWDIYAPQKPIAIAGTSFPLFGKNKCVF
ncbi:hypothetical protein BASA62_007901 [Batrachochytrium salamandrivorans]|nr:hypothetical protein BASA62_007901 [Batrachochytrium salamandrivorans]